MIMRNDFYHYLKADQKEKFAMLFKDKNKWYERRLDGTINHDKRTIDDATFNRYKEALKDFIELQKDEVEYDLNSIHFAGFNCSDFFGKGIDKPISFGSATFSDRTDFFNHIFSGKANFSYATFSGETRFLNATFSDEAYFFYAIFSGKASFRQVIFEKIFLLSYAKINTLDIENIKYEDANFLHIVGIDKNKKLHSLTKENFASKESARLIKAHFEEAGNITEANKYFVIEQEKYIEALRDKNNKTENGKTVKLIPLYLNKYISHFGTDWLRSVLSLFLFGFIALFSYMTLRYSFLTFPNEFYISGEWHQSNILNTMSLFGVLFLIYFINISIDEFKQFRPKLVEIYKKYPKIFYLLSIFALAIFIYASYDSDLFNLISKLINPINAFKDDDTYQGYEAFGMIVRIMSATIIYQIIVAFRQFTRRG